MLNINTNLLAGGNYVGQNNWNKKATSLDQCFKLYQIVHGRAILFSDGIKHSLEAGQIYFINGFKIEKQCCQNKFEVNWLHFMPDSIFLKQILRKLPLLITFSPEEIRDFQKPFDIIQNNFKNILAQKKNDRFSSMPEYLKIQSFVIQVVSILIANSKTDTNEDLLIENRFSKAIEYINSNYKKQISLKTLASICFMSDNYFHSLFKKSFEITPNNYILQLRMNEAISLLAHSQLSIKEIAEEIGYFDAAYFSRTFSNYFEMSPKQYRNSLELRIP
jgi:AraC-like DNA-binding protein